MSEQKPAYENEKNSDNNMQSRSPITRRSILKGTSAFGLSSAFLGSGVEITAAHEVSDHLVETPPMGWNSWNTFEQDIDETLIKEIADAMVDSGMKAAGYEYVTIDDYWMEAELSENGELKPDSDRFPNGIKPVADYVHSKGLKFGIYSTAGSITCQRLAGSLGHEYTHAEQFADWGVDYLKYDHCGTIDADIPDIDKITISDGGSFSATFEAEADENILSGSAEIVDCDGCSGDQKVTGLEGNNQGSLTFEGVKVPDDGEYQLTIHYAHGGDVRVGYHPTAYVLINENKRTDRLRFDPTGGWDSTDSLTAAIDLSEGTNSLKIFNPQTDWESKYDAFSRMRDAIDSVDQDIVLSINANVGQEVTHDGKSWADIANLWRTTQDIKPCWDCGPGNWYNGVSAIIDRNEPLAPLARPGHWNDPDMLEVGVEVEGFPGLTAEESRSHFSLWAMMAAPLNAGNDLRNMSETTREILTNEEVIAVNQDPTAEQGRRIRDDGNVEVWKKPLVNDDVAVVLFNRGDTATQISTSSNELGFGKGGPGYVVHDLWSKTEEFTTGEISDRVPAHGVTMYRVRPGTPDEAPSATTLTVSPRDATVSAGGRQELRTSLTNDGRTAIENVEFNVDGPSGWSVSATSSASSANLPPDRTTNATWLITAPEDATPGEYRFEAEATFQWDDGSKTATKRTEWSWEVALDPVPDRYSTYASTDAEFGASGETLVVNANGVDVWESSFAGQNDEYGAIYEDNAIGENATVVTKVTSQEATNEWAKAGLMVRNDVTGAGSSSGYVILCVTPENGFHLQYDSDGNGYLDDGPDAGSTMYPCWLKLEKHGSTFIGYFSSDGETWTEIGTVDVPEANDNQDVGMFVTSHASERLSEVWFDDFTVEDSGDSQ